MPVVKMPNLCAQCGENPPDMFIAMEAEMVTTKNIVELSVLRKTTVQVMSCQIPLCNECRQQIKMYDNIAAMLRIITILIMMASLAMIFVPANLLSGIPWLMSLATRFKIQAATLPFAVAGVLFFLGLLIGIAGKMTGGLHVVNTNGKTFRFYNKDFQRAFARLNPDLVRQSPNRS